MSYKRETIKAQLATNLALITTGNGFENTVQIVSRKFLQYDQCSQYPALVIVTGDSPLRFLASNETTEQELNFTILGYVKSGEDIDKSGDLDAALESLAGDVMKKIYDDVRLSNPAFVDFVELTNFEPFYDWENNIGIFAIDGRVLFTASFDSP